MANRIKKVAIVGASGNSGSYMTKSLLESGQFSVTALTRDANSIKVPDGVTVKSIDYNQPSTITSALEGHDALVITLAGRTPSEIKQKLNQAAANANVRWILPNQWSPDVEYEGYQKDVPAFRSHLETRDHIKQLGKSSYISVLTGFWYEWSLAIPPAYGFDFEKREVTFFDDGETLTTMSTWPQVGRAVAALLSLPIQPEGDNKERCLEHFKNRSVYVSSFTISQKDMLESVLRVTGDKLEDWKITKESSHERHANASKKAETGDMVGFVKQMYTRIFFPDEHGNYEKLRGTQNELLGLPKEDLDEATKAAIERSKAVKIV